MNAFAAEVLTMLAANAAVATLLALGAYVAQRLDRPRLVHALCVLALLKLITPPLWSVSVAPAARAQPLDEIALWSALLDAPAATAVPTPAMAEFPWALGLLAVAAAGTFLLLLGAGRRSRAFRRLLHAGEPPSAALRTRAAAWAARLGLARCPELLLVPARLSPMLCVVGSGPRLVLPRDLVRRVRPAQLDALLVHELAHAARRDHWVRLLECVAFACTWWLPTTWWLRRALHVAEERCCDLHVLATIPEHRRAYADALLDTVDFLAGAQRAMPPVACGASAFTDLKTRLSSIMTRSNPRPVSRLSHAGLLALAAAVLPVTPSFAQETERRDEARARAELREAAREVAKLRAEIDAIRADLDTARAAGKNAQGTHKVEMEDLHEHIQQVVKQALENAKVGRGAAEEAMRKLHEAGAKVESAAVKRHIEEAMKQAHGALAKVMEGDAVHEHVQHAHEIAQKAHEQARAAMEKAMVERDRARAVEAEKAATDAEHEARREVVNRLRRRAAAEERNEAREAESTRRRNDSDRADEIRAIEQQMRELQRRLEALRREGGRNR